MKFVAIPQSLLNTTVEQLRSRFERYPYYQTARLLYLQKKQEENHLSDDEMHDFALFVSDCRNLYALTNVDSEKDGEPGICLPKVKEGATEQEETMEIPEIQGSQEEEDSEPEMRHVRPEERSVHRSRGIPDAATDYVSYLIQTEGQTSQPEVETATPLRGQRLIDDFIEKSPLRVSLSDQPEYVPSGPMLKDDDDADSDGEDDYFTETLAKIYIKQGRYEKALEIIRKLMLDYPKKNSYFADQIRFLEKLILNGKSKK